MYLISDLNIEQNKTMHFAVNTHSMRSIYSFFIILSHHHYDIVMLIINYLFGMKAIIIAILLVALVYAQSPELVKCIEDGCPTQYDKCKKTKGCEDKLNKCAAKCG